MRSVPTLYACWGYRFVPLLAEVRGHCLEGLRAYLGLNSDLTFRAI